MRARWRRLVIGAACLVAAALFLWFARPTDPATRVLTLPAGARFYGWLTNREIFCVGWRQASGWFASRIDTTSGASASIPSIEDVLKNAWPQGEFHASPDGKRILWNAAAAWRPGSRRNRYFVVVSDIGGGATIDDRIGENLAWAPDGRNWLRFICLYRIPQVQVHSLGSSSLTRVPIPSVPEQVMPGPGGLPIATLAGSRVLGVTRDGNLLVGYPRAAPPTSAGQSVPCAELDWRTPSLSRRYSIAVPNDRIVLGLTLSPRGDRLAWHALRSGPSGLTAHLLAWLHLLPLQPEETAEIWTSRLDGSGPSAVCTLHASRPRGPINPNAKDELTALDVQWTPDGRRISFARGGSLYTVPVR